MRIVAAPHFLKRVCACYLHYNYGHWIGEFLVNCLILFKFWSHGTWNHDATLQLLEFENKFNVSGHWFRAQPRDGLGGLLSQGRTPEGAGPRI